MALGLRCWLAALILLQLLSCGTVSAQGEVSAIRMPEKGPLHPAPANPAGQTPPGIIMPRCWAIAANWGDRRARPPRVTRAQLADRGRLLVCRHQLARKRHGQQWHTQAGTRHQAMQGRA
jgi:hypothetical protein